MDILASKKCCTCQQWKSLDHFSKDTKAKDGRCYQCRECHKRAAKAWALTNAEKIKQYRIDTKEQRQQQWQAWASKNKEHMRTYRQENREKKTLQQKNWILNNLVRVQERRRAYYQRIKDIRAIKQKIYVAENKEKIRARRRAHRHAHPETVRTENKQRRAQRKQAPVNDLTHAQWLEIQVAQDHRCYYCGKRCKGKLTQDHIQPLSKGGSHTVHNVIGACQSCNSRKHANPPPIPVQPLLLTIAPAKKPKRSASSCVPCLPSGKC
jgi:hypothetical protein